jgi:DNA-binding MltR family transcriptional regulator
MSNREALRKLSRKFPAPPEIDKIMDDLGGEKDISVAIVAAAIAEAALEQLIAGKFKTKNASLRGQIFLNQGPLSDFHSKILIAAAFGIITVNMGEELHSIKAIRNTFAHAKVAISFDHELVGREINSLKMLTAIRNVETETKHKLELSNKSWFLLITKILLIMFDTISKHAGTADQAVRDALAADDRARSSP